MALNASGPISLGGSTAGQSVNLETGASATAQVSMNDAAVRVLTNTITGAPVSMPADFWGQTYRPPAGTYLYGPISGGNPTYQFSPVCHVTDSDGNTYMAGQFTTSLASPYSFPGVIKVNKLGVIVWQKYYTGFAYEIYVYAQGSGTGLISAALDASNNFYFTFYPQFVAGRGPGVIKVDSNGVFQWCTQLVPPTSPADYGFTNGIQIDSSGNLYAVGLGQVASVTSTYIAKFNSSGSLVSIVYVPNFTASAFIADSSANLYISGYTQQSIYSSTFATGSVTKLNSSLVTQWTNYYTVTASGYSGANCLMPTISAMNISAAGDLYCGGAVNYYRGSGPPYYYGYGATLRVNTSTGAVISATAQRLSSNYSSTTITSITTDSSNNVYTLAASNNIDQVVGSQSAGVLLKYPSTLASVTYQYRFSQLGYDSSNGRYLGTFPNKISAVGNYILISSWGSTTASSTFGPTIFQFPNNGSYFGANRYFYPPATSTGYLYPDNPGFSTDSTFAATANSTSYPATALTTWSSASRSLSDAALTMTALTTTY